MRVQCPVRANLPFETQVPGVGREQQFDGRGIEPDAVVQAGDAVLCV